MGISIAIGGGITLSTIVIVVSVLFLGVDQIFTQTVANMVISSTLTKSLPPSVVVRLY